MITPILMPQVGQDLETGKLLELYVKEGDEVKKGDMVALVESEKATFEVEAFASGTVVKLCCNVGDEAVVLEPLILLGDSDELATDIKPKEPVGDDVKADAQPVSQHPGKDNQPGEKIRSSPLARKFAKKNGIDLSGLNGSGPGGRILKRDVLAAYNASDEHMALAAREPETVGQTKITKGVAQQSLSASAGDKVVPFNKMRKKIAAALCKSKQTIPHFYVQRDVDMSDVLDRRATWMSLAKEKFSINDLLIKVSEPA